MVMASIDIERLEAVLSTRVEDGTLGVGIAMAIVDGDKTAFVNVGQASKQESLRLDSHTLFEIGSVTKTFTGLRTHPEVDLFCFEVNCTATEPCNVCHLGGNFLVGVSYAVLDFEQHARRLAIVVQADRAGFDVVGVVGGRVGERCTRGAEHGDSR